MKSFHMLAGSVMTELKLPQIQSSLAEFGILSNFLDDELALAGQANLLFRYGFDHEVIVVGDAVDKASLLEDCLGLSAALKHLRLAHDFELYDRQNQLFEQIEFQP